ncbi:MAG: hypothetical protein ACYS32_07720 [Planctomycetota bacterium]|jgi:hypothetical protein
MDIDTFLTYVFVVVFIFLGFRGAYLYERLKRYVDRQYPEEGKVIRSYEWQMYPWSVGHRTLKALIKRESANDPELARWAGKWKRSAICLLVFFAFLLLESGASFIYYVLLTPPK